MTETESIEYRVNKIIVQGNRYLHLRKYRKKPVKNGVQTIAEACKPKKTFKNNPTHNE